MDISLAAMDDSATSPVKALASFLIRRHSDQLLSIAHSPDPKLHYPLFVEFAELMDDDPPLARLVFSHPTEYLRIFDDAAVWAHKITLGDSKGCINGIKKDFIHVRINVAGSPLEWPETSPSIGSIRVKHRGVLLTLKGTVIRSGAIKMYEGERWYICRKCKHKGDRSLKDVRDVIGEVSKLLGSITNAKIVAELISTSLNGLENVRILFEGKETLVIWFPVYPELETRNSIQLPSFCPSQRAKPCEGKSFECLEGSVVRHDYQEIKIQESTQVLGVGSIPRAILVILKDDLVDLVKAGDDVIVTGVLSAKWSPDIKDVRCDLDPMLIANHVRRTNELKAEVDIPDDIIMNFRQFWSDFKDTPLKGRNAILRGICPQVFGLFTVKLAVALTLIGGVQHVDVSGTKVRGESHLLLVGDPGTGKSQFLKFAAKLSNRAVITTGLGSTSAGLTVAAVKDGGEWMLEAGALVLADGGLCCIDEVDSMREHDRATIHEAMEQQTISVAKAGLVTTLSTRTIVFGATNPKGHYDPEQPSQGKLTLLLLEHVFESLTTLSVNTTLSGPLLSRFDIVLVLLDTKNPEWDAVVSSHILSECQQEKGKRDNDLSSNWPLTMLRRYLQFVKGYFRPVLTKEAEQIISSYYQLQRRSAMDNAARTTVRMLESLIRLAQAHARLMFRNEVTRLDAITAILCIESSMTTSALVDSVGNALHSNFTENPDEEYAKQEILILEKLKSMDEFPEIGS